MQVSRQYQTVVVNADECSVLIRELLIKETPVTVELASNGRSKEGRIVHIRSLVEGALRPFGHAHQSGDFRGSLFETSSLVQITTNSVLATVAR